jgi:hypothetical protein
LNGNRTSQTIKKNCNLALFGNLQGQAFNSSEPIETPDFLAILFKVKKYLSMGLSFNNTSLVNYNVGPV